MNVSTLISYIPDAVKTSIINFTDVRLKDGRPAIRVTLDHVATPAELDALQASRHIMGAGCICYSRSAPEIQRSYFYVVQRVTAAKKKGGAAL